jgi:Mn-containing catalase
MLNKGAKGELAEGVDNAAEMYRKINGAGNDSHVTQILYGAGTPLINSAGVPWTAAYIDTIGEPSADLRSNIAAEARAKIVYERLISCTDDPGVKEALGFLMTREVAHQKSFEKALYSMTPNFPPGKMPVDPRFANTYFNMSQGDGEMRGSWNQGDNWDFVTDREKQMAVDGGSGEAEVKLPSRDIDILKALTTRTMSNPAVDPTTGAELGMGK